MQRILPLALGAALASLGLAPAATAAARVASLSANAATVVWDAPRAERTWLEVGSAEPFGTWYPGERQADGEYRATLIGLQPQSTYRFRVVTETDGVRSESLGALETPPIGPFTRAETRGRQILLDGHPLFPILAWGQCPENYPPLLALGVNVFLGGCPFRAGETMIAALGGQAYIVLPTAVAGLEGTGVIGYSHPDEPEGFGIPATALRDLPPAAESGRLRTLTVTYHFYSVAAPISPTRGKDIYPEYFRKADVLGFDLYPTQKLCGNTWIGMTDVYDAMREFITVHVLDKPSYQWIETGPLEGECAWSHPLTPEQLRAEVWLALAGGATGLGYFTHTWVKDFWKRFEVDPRIEAEIGRVNGEIRELAPALVQPAEVAETAGGTALRVGVRRLNGATYVIAVNAGPLPLSADVYVRGVGTQTLTVFGEDRSTRARVGVVTDDFAPYAVHVYVAPPSDRLVDEPRPSRRAWLPDVAG